MSSAKNTDQYWSELYRKGRDYSLISSFELSEILSFADRGLPKTCLDIGCGVGQLTRELWHRGYQCLGVDVSAEAIKIAKSLTIASSDQLQYERLDIEHDQLPDKKYALITCKLVFAFIDNKPAFLEKVRQHLLPGGIFVVIAPRICDAPDNRKNIGMSENELALLQSHFRQKALYKNSNVLTYFIGE